MMWRLLMRRCPTRSMTLVGDPAQTAEPGGCGAWESILAPYVDDRWELVRLGVNYRTPSEIMEIAAEVPRAVDASFEPPRSIRSTGVRPWALGAAADDLPRAVADAVVRETADGSRSRPAEAGEGGDGGPGEGRLAVIAPKAHHPALAAALCAALPDVSTGADLDLTRPVVLLDPRQAKGLEFDTVLVVEPAGFGTSDLYVALTRATQRLGVVHTGTLPTALRSLADAATEPEAAASGR